MIYNTLYEVLKNRSDNQPGEIAYAEINKDLSIRKQLSNRELYSRARSIATYIKNLQNDPNNPVFIFSSSRLEFIELFWGTIFSGAPAIALNLPNFIFYKKQQKRINSIFKKVTEAKVGLYSSADKTLFDEYVEKNPDILNIQWICVDESIATDQKSFESFKYSTINPENTAVIQFTSGSTGNPKGVELSHKKIIANLEGISNHRGRSSFKRGIFWLPHNHDMGLIGGYLTAFYAGGLTYLIKTQDYLKNPMLWLQSISKYRCTCTPAPHFAIEGLIKICNKAPVDLDLSSLKLIFNGAEFVNYKTLVEFVDVYKKFGLNEESICISYGLAEATLMVSGTSFNRQKSIIHISKKSARKGQLIVQDSQSVDSMTLVSCGKAIEGCLFVIDSPQIGHVLINGLSVVDSYYLEEDKGRFDHKSISNQDLKFFNTNDIGFIYQDELYIIGRQDDVIVHNGEKLHNSDIALVLSESVDKIVQGSIFAFKSQGQFKIAVESNEEDLTETIKQNISKCFFSEYLIMPEVYVFRVGYLPRTTSGKIVRQEAIEKIENENSNKTP